jgi:hypothetical protein
MKGAALLLISLPEVPHPGENHGKVMFVGSGDDFRNAHCAARQLFLFRDIAR